jgi:F-type H+-transporting ATPase subunit c
MTKTMPTRKALPSPHTDDPSSSTNDPEVIRPFTDHFRLENFETLFKGADTRQSKENWIPMTTIVKMAAFALFALLLVDQGSAFAQEGSDAAAAAASWGKGLGAGLAAGLAVLGAGLGIGRIGSEACNATARQPEMGGKIFINMILTAALIEGVALFAVVVGFLMGAG